MNTSSPGGSGKGARAGDVMVTRSFRVGGPSAPSGRGTTAKEHRWWCCICEARGVCRTHEEAMKALLTHSDIHPARPERRHQ